MMDYLGVERTKELFARTSAALRERFARFENPAALLAFYPSSIDTLYRHAAAPPEIKAPVRLEPSAEPRPTGNGFGVVELARLPAELRAAIRAHLGATSGDDGVEADAGGAP